MFVIDSKKERIAVNEANKLTIPIIALVDTNADPDLITVPIAGNDDAIRSVELMAKSIADAIVEARREAPVREEVEEAESNTYSSDRGAEPEGEGDRVSPYQGDREGREARRQADERRHDRQLHPPQRQSRSAGGSKLRDGLRRAHRRLQAAGEVRGRAHCGRGSGCGRQGSGSCR